MLSSAVVLTLIGKAALFYAIGFAAGKTSAWIRAIRDVV